jgi:hypothetical protein
MGKLPGSFNHGLTLVNAGWPQITTNYYSLFQHFHPDHFDARITDIHDFEFVVADDDAVFQAGNGLVLVDDIAGERFRFRSRADPSRISY